MKPGYYPDPNEVKSNRIKKMIEAWIRKTARWGRIDKYGH